MNYPKSLFEGRGGFLALCEAVAGWWGSSHMLQQSRGGGVVVVVCVCVCVGGATDQ